LALWTNRTSTSSTIKTNDFRPFGEILLSLGVAPVSKMPPNQPSPDPLRGAALVHVAQ
jgi:hypothetical protein